MTISKGNSYTLRIDPFPWTNEFARSHSAIGATLLTEDQARKLLDGQYIEITDTDPDQSLFYKGDLNVVGKWVKGCLISGSLAGSTVAVLDIWLGSGGGVTHICSCDINTLMAGGCQCGGV